MTGRWLVGRAGLQCIEWRFWGGKMIGSVGFEQEVGGKF